MHSDDENGDAIADHNLQLSLKIEIIIIRSCVRGAIAGVAW
jgi:hypothetical protein